MGPLCSSYVHPLAPFPGPRGSEERVHSSPLTPVVLSCRGIDSPVGPLLILIPPQARAPPRPLASSQKPKLQPSEALG